MYKIPQTQVSFRIKQDEREKLQEVCDELQEKNEIVFENSKQLVFAMIAEIEALKNKVNSPESNVNKDENSSNSDETKTETIENETEINSESNLKPLFNQARKAIGYEDKDIPNDEAVLSDLIDIIQTPIKPEQKEVIKEVEKEVERKLKENEILLELTADQSKVIELIARWRYSKRIDEPKKTSAEIIKSMTFNKGTLLNHSGYFRTGIKPKNLKS